MRKPALCVALLVLLTDSLGAAPVRFRFEGLYARGGISLRFYRDGTAEFCLEAGKCVTSKIGYDHGSGKFLFLVEKRVAGSPFAYGGAISRDGMKVVLASIHEPKETVEQKDKLDFITLEFRKSDGTVSPVQPGPSTPNGVDDKPVQPVAAPVDAKAIERALLQAMTNTTKVLVLETGDPHISDEDGTMRKVAAMPISAILRVKGRQVEIKRGGVVMMGPVNHADLLSDLELAELVAVEVGKLGMVHATRKKGDVTALFLGVGGRARDKVFVVEGVSRIIGLVELE